MNKAIYTAVLATVTSLTFGQQTAAGGWMSSEWGSFNMISWVLIIISILLLIVVWALRVTLKKMLEQQMLEKMAAVTKEQDFNAFEKREFLKQGFWERFFQLRPKAIEADLMLGHDQDGIEELDNPTPGWFMALFYGTVIFAVIYLLNYHVFKLTPLQDEEYTIEVQRAKEARDNYIRTAGASVTEETVTALTDAASIEEGQKIFAGKCAVCHGPQGQGNQVGPNLTDDYWLHGGTIQDVFRTIKQGVPAKGMISWESQLNPLQMQQVASYVMSIVGSNPPDAKAPQGEKSGGSTAPADTPADTATVTTTAMR